MKERTQRKPAARKRASKKYPKIVVVPATAEEILAAHNITPAEIRRARRILETVRKRSSPAAK